MKWEEGPCTLSSPSVGPRGRACPGRGVESKDPFTAVDLARLGADTGPLLGRREESLPVWAVTVLGLLLYYPLLSSRPEPAGAASRKPAWAGLALGGAQSSGLHPHQAPRLGLVPSHSLRLQVAATGLGPHSWKMPSSPSLPGPQGWARQWEPGLHWIFPDITYQNPGQGPEF